MLTHSLVDRDKYIKVSKVSNTSTYNNYDNYGKNNITLPVHKCKRLVIGQ